MGVFEGYDDDTVNYHKALMIEKGLIEGKAHYSNRGEKHPDIPDFVIIKRPEDRVQVHTIHNRG